VNLAGIILQRLSDYDYTQKIEVLKVSMSAFRIGGLLSLLASSCKMLRFVVQLSPASYTAQRKRRRCICKSLPNSLEVFSGRLLAHSGSEV